MLSKQHLNIITTFCLFIVCSGCSPTVKLQSPKEPIEININIKIEEEVRVKLDKDIDGLINKNNNLF